MNVSFVDNANEFKGNFYEGDDMIEKRKVEFIESYIKGVNGSADYQYCDNHGELIRCKDCKKRYTVLCIQEEAGNINNQDNWYCADGERKE